MAARYNNYAGGNNITNYEPYLALVNHVSGSGTAVYSTNDTPVTMGILQDLLEWNKLDPVDDYEIHRNNLIYKNYQGNRNPFIDFPQWADYIWGTSVNGVYDSNPTGKANVSTDEISAPSNYVPSEPSQDTGFKLDTKMIIIIAVVAGVVIIALIIILAVSKKARKKAGKLVKKQAKKTVKNYAKSQSKSSNSSKSKKK